jgi:hypothetical protein
MTVNNDAFEFDDRLVFRESSIRLHAALLAHGYSKIPAPATLCDSLCEWYEMQDFQLARALTLPTIPLDWHLIRIGPAGEPLTQGIDVLTIAPSLARAFAGLQIEMDQARVFPHDVTRTDRGILCHARAGGLIASIEPAHVQPADLQKRERVNNLMKGLRIHRDGVRFVKCLSSLPGFQALQDDHPPSNDHEPSGAMAVPTVDNQCVAMRRMLSEDHGIEVPQHDAQALVAVTFGAADWARYIAKRDTAPGSLIPAAIVHWARDVPVTQARVALYPTLAEAVFAFGQYCHHSTKPLFPYFSGVSRTGYCYGPWLQADEAPLDKDWRKRTESPHQCTHLPLLDCDSKSELRARTLLSDSATFADRVRKFFVTDGPTRDRLRASNRRRGIANSQELFIGDWLFTTGSYDNTAEGRHLTMEKFRADVRLLTETVTLYKSVCVRESDGQWCIVTEYGRKDVVVLEGLAESDVRRMAAKFGMRLTSRNADGAPEKDVSQ